MLPMHSTMSNGDGDDDDGRLRAARKLKPVTGSSVKLSSASGSGSARASAAPARSAPPAPAPAPWLALALLGLLSLDAVAGSVSLAGHNDSEVRGISFHFSRTRLDDIGLQSQKQARMRVRVRRPLVELDSGPARMVKRQAGTHRHSKPPRVTAQVVRIYQIDGKADGVCSPPSHLSRSPRP